MGQQVILLVVLSVLIVGISVVVGITMFNAQNVQSNRDLVSSDMVNLAADCFQYKSRPSTMIGGNGSYAGYTISSTGGWGPSNPNAVYTISVATDSLLVLTGTSNVVPNATIVMSFDGNGNATSPPVYTGY
jgi:hypothetical protein